MTCTMWLASLLTLALAYPSSMDCDFACLGGYTPGSSFGLMYGVPTIGATSGDTCKIATDIPTDGYAPGASYTVTVTSTDALAQKVACSAGGFAGQMQVNGMPKDTTHSYVWTAPAGGTASFRALCGDSSEMWAASLETVSIGSGPFTTVATTATTTAAVAGIELGSGVMLYAAVNGDDLDVEVTYSGNAWVGIGFIEGQSLSMTGGSGGGADTFICSSQANVVRYWMTQYDVPSGGAAVPGSSCSSVSGVNTMRFTRTLAAATAMEIPITLGSAQMVIWAHGSSTTLSYHGGANRGGSLVDFATLSATGATLSAGPVLLIHLILMALGWGTLLPWGVAIAARTRTVVNAVPGGWSRWHRRIQTAGVLLQLIGFALAVWHVQENGIHFNSGHKIIGLVVVVLGTSQPFNALLRKTCAHPTPGEKKTMGRTLWEVVHKGLGYAATLLGMMNCWLGVVLLIRNQYDVGAIVVAASLSGIGTCSVVLYAILSFIDKDNCISRMLVGEGHYAVEVKPIGNEQMGA